MNVPNQLTVARIALTFVMALFLTVPAVPFGKTLALLVFAAAGLTDCCDGYLARRGGRITAFGQLMDPLADKILVSAAFVSFVAIGGIVPAWIVILILSREFLVTGLRLLAAGKGRILEAGRWGKHKMISQTAAIVATMAGLALREDVLARLSPPERAGAAMQAFDVYFGRATLVMYVIVAAITAVTGWRYLSQNRAVYRDDVWDEPRQKL